MTTMPPSITGGVDTHLDVHVAAALDDQGALLGVESFETTADGYRSLLDWLGSFGQVVLVGVEGTGSYGAGLTRSLLNRIAAPSMSSLIMSPSPNASCWLGSAMNG